MADAVQAVGQLQQGMMARRAANYEAKQMEAAGMQEYARGVRQAREAKRQGDVMLSNARAAMAAGGGTTTDAQALDIQGRIGEVSEYNRMSALYQGAVRKQDFEQRATLRRYEGKQAQYAARIGATTSALKAGQDALTMGAGGA